MTKISALTLSGGKLSKFGGQSAVKEYRVWVHPKGGGDDYYFVAKSLDEISRKGQSLVNKGDYVEKPLAVVWDAKYKKYREVVIDKKSILKSQIKSGTGLNIAKETAMWS